MSDLFTIGDAAAALARNGLRVFPCLELGKTPVVHWKRHSTTRIPQIRRWWAARPDLNYGIHTGASGLVVLDLDRGKPWDPRWGDQPTGVESGADALVHLAEQTGNVGDGSWLFDAPSVRTPSGGMHFYYRAPDQPIGPSASKLAPWVDVRGGDSYVVGPWSNASSGSYRPIYGWSSTVSGDADAEFRVWNAQLESISVDFPMLPSWIVERISDQPKRQRVAVSPIERLSAALDAPTASGGYLSAALAREIEAVSMAVEGTRNDTLNRAAYSLAGLIPHLPENRIVEALMKAATVCGLDQIEARSCISGAIRRGKQSPRRVSVYA